MQRNSDCIHKSYTSKKFRKNYPKGYVKNKVYKFTSEGMLEEASLCNCPFWDCFSRCIKSHVSPSPATQELWCSCVLNPSFSAPASKLLSISATTISDTSCYSYFLFLYLIITITAFQQQPRIFATFLFCWFKITVTRQRSISAHIILFLIECTGVYLDSIWKRIGRKEITLWSEWYKSCFSQMQLFNANTVPLLRFTSNEIQGMLS